MSTPEPTTGGLTGGGTPSPVPSPSPGGSATPNYVLLATASTVQVLSATLVIDAVLSTVQTNESGIIASLTLPAGLLTTDAGVLELNTFTNNLETILADNRVSAVTGAQSIDDNGLLQDSLDITVAYSPPGSQLPPLTQSITTPYSDVRATGGITGGTVTGSSVEAAIADAYQQLVTLAGG